MPVPTTQDKNRGPIGLAKVKISGNKIHIDFEDKTRYPSPFVLDKDSYEGALVAGRMNVRMSKDATELYGMFPADGNHFVRFLKFSAQENQLPAFRDIARVIKNGPNGESYPVEAHREFTALLEIVGGSPYDGMVIPLTLWDLFHEYEGVTALKTGRYKAYKKVLVKPFLELAGMDFLNDTLEYSENILPALEKLLKQRDTVFFCNVQEGWVNTLSPAPEHLVPKKKATKKKARK